MTGIVRDEALRGDALAGALASSEKKTERERLSEREDSWGTDKGGERAQGHVEENRKARGRR